MSQKNKRLPRVQAAALALLLGLLCGTLPLSAQDAVNRTTDPLKSKYLDAAKSLPTDLSSVTAYEGVVDREQYLVGPGDKLILQIWSPAYEEVPILVSGDGRVAVPYAGPVQVAGTALSEAERLIAAEFERALKRGRVSVSLLEPRMFRVHVTGEVLVPGTYKLRATSRVADAILEGGGIRSFLRIQNGDTIAVPQANLRLIEMRGMDGRVHAVDLLRFYRGGDLRGNPLLLDGAVIYVPPLADGPKVGVFGEVQYPDLYIFASGDNVETILNLAGGLTANADSARVTIQRSAGSTEQISLAAGGLTARLEPGDRVHVGGKPHSRVSGSAMISGQVAKPGAYMVTPGVTTVQELLYMAGGLLPGAEIRSARLERRNDDRTSAERLRLLYNPIKTLSKDDPWMLADQELSAEFSRWEYGTVVLDLSAQQKAPGWAGDVRLQDGDRLEIPEQPLGVRVLGYVNHAGEVPWIEGGDLSHYLEKAGGKNKAGWKGRAVLIKGRNGSQIRYSSKVSIDPGDVVFVPQRPRTTGWDRIKDVITVVAQLATVVLVIDSASK